MVSYECASAGIHSSKSFSCQGLDSVRVFCGKSCINVCLKVVTVSTLGIISKIKKSDLTLKLHDTDVHGKLGTGFVSGSGQLSCLHHSY